MTDQTASPPMPGVIPYISVEGAGEAAEFYKKAFGAIEHRRMPGQDGKRLLHVHLEINGGALMMSDPFPEDGYPFTPSPSVTLQLVVDDAQPWWDRAVAAGCEIVTPLQVMFWGDTYGQLKDPYQMQWAINAATKG